MGYLYAKGNSAYINCKSSSVLSNTSSMTIASWMFPFDAGGGGNGRIVHKHGSSAAQCRLFYVGATGGSGGIEISWEVRFQTTALLRTVSAGITGAPKINSWNLVIGVWAGNTAANNSNFNIWINGNTVSLYSINQNGVGPLVNDSLGDLYLGNRSDTIRSFNGYLGDIAIWNTELSESEVKSLTNNYVKGAMLQIRPSNLIAYYPLDEVSDNNTSPTTSNMVRDRSANSNNGTVTGTMSGSAERLLSYP